MRSSTLDEKRMTDVSQAVAKAGKNTGQAGPVTSRSTCPEVEGDTTEKGVSSMETEQALVTGTDKDALVSLGHANVPAKVRTEGKDANEGESRRAAHKKPRGGAPPPKQRPVCQQQICVLRDGANPTHRQLNS